MIFPTWILAGWWGLIAGIALVLGAAVGYCFRVPQRVIAGIMAFGSGVLISALSFDLMDEAYQRGGFDSTAIGFLGGAAAYTAANWFLNHRGQTSQALRSRGKSTLRGGAERQRIGDCRGRTPRRHPRIRRDWP